MADVWDDLDRITHLAKAHDSSQLFAFGRERCLALAGESVVDALAALDTAGYVAGLEVGAHAAAAKAQEVEAQAVYFEYDPDNQWSSNFFICGSYSAADSAWASEWQDRVPGPSMAAFAAQYDSRFGDDPSSQGRTVMLVARTMAALVDATAWWPGGLVLAAAYHDQDQITTIWPPMT
jgi:hypothetical protein